jgi:FkbM family methyltransferase
MSSVPSPTEERVVRTAAERGRQHFELEEFNEAEFFLWENIRTSPRAPTATYLLGLIKMIQGHWQEGRRLVERAYSLKPWVDDRVLTPRALRMVAEAEHRFPDWVWPKYQLARERWRAVNLSLSTAVDHLVATKGRPPSFLQVGANDGRSGDPVAPLIKRVGMRGTFVEPQPTPLNSLRERYEGVAGLSFVPAAITEEDGPVTLFTDPSRTTLGTLDPSRNLMRDRGETTVELTVDGLTFESLASRFGIGEFDLLQLDTEGYDYKILKQVPLTDCKVQVVNMEHFCLPLDERLAACRYLEDHGFAYTFDVIDILAVRQDTFADAFCLTRFGSEEVATAL